MEETCETCRFGVYNSVTPNHTTLDTVTCHVRSPAGDHFPTRRPEDWCGEWQESDEDAQQRLDKSMAAVTEQLQQRPVV